MRGLVLGAMAAAWLALPACLAAETPPSSGLSPGVVRQTPAIYRFTIGDANVTALSDGTMPLDLHRLVRGLTAVETDALLSQSFLANPVESSVNCYLIETGGRTILIDTGTGVLFGSGNAGRLQEALAIAGVAPDKISDILLTHAHPDHIGGLASHGKMNFINARVHVGKADIEPVLAQATDALPGLPGLVAGMLKPYADAGKLRPFDHNGEILPGISAELRPGHSPGSAIFRVKSRGQELVVIGDIIHIAAVQLPKPDATMVFDADQDMARADRLAILEEFAREGTLVASPHISFPGVGHFRADGAGYRWFPVEYANRNPDAAAPKIP